MPIPEFLQGLKDKLLSPVSDFIPSAPVQEAKSNRITDEQKKDIIERIQWQYDTVKTDVESRTTEFEKAWKQFSSRGETKLHIPKTFTQSWVLLAKAMNVFLTPNNFFNATPRRGQDTRPEATMLSEGMKYELYTIPDFAMAVIKHFFQAIVDKHTVLKSGWDFDNACPLFPFILNEDVWWDKTAHLNNQIRWLHQRVLMSKDEVEALGKTGYFQNTKSFIDKVADYEKKNKTELGENPYRDMVEIRECWDKKECVVVGYSDNEPKEVLRRIDNRLKRLPYYVGVFVPDLKGMSGFSIPEIMKHLQIELDVNARLRIEHIKYELMGSYLYPENKAFSEKAIEIMRTRKPGQFIPKPEGMVLENIYERKNSNPLFLEGRDLDLEIQDVTSAYNVSKGQLPGRKETLGALEMAKESGNERQMAFLLVMSQALDYIGKVMLQHIFWYENSIPVEQWDEEKGTSIQTTLDFSKFRNDDVFNTFNIQVTSDLNPTKMLDIASFFRVIELLEHNVFQNSSIDWDELGREAVELIKPGYGKKVFKGEIQGLINSLKKLPAEELKTIIRLGTQMMRMMEKEQISAGGMGGLGGGNV